MIDFAVLCSVQNYYQKTGVPNFLGKKSVTKSTRNVLLFNYLNFWGRYISVSGVLLELEMGAQVLFKRCIEVELL